MVGVAVEALLEEELDELREEPSDTAFAPASVTDEEASLSVDEDDEPDVDLLAVSVREYPLRLRSEPSHFVSMTERTPWLETEERAFDTAVFKSEFELATPMQYPPDFCMSPMIFAPEADV